MEKGFNNSDIRRCGHFNDYQIFFIQRWLEVLNSNTHGRYSIKYLNSHQALKEVVRVCQGILNDEIKSKEIHLKLAIEEASQIVNKDILFKTESEEYHRIVRRCFSSIPKVTQIPKIYSLIYQLKYVIKHLKTHYLKWIVDRLKLLLFDSDNTNQIQDGKLEEIDSLILSLISELLGKGWSVKRLYELIKLDLLDQSDENQKWDRFLTTIMSECRTYICIFRFKQQPKELLKEKMKQFELDLLPGTYLSEEYSELSEHVSATQSYLRVAVNAYDRHSAVNTAWFQIVEKLDILRFYGFTPLEISNTPIVIGDGKLFTRNVHVSLISDKKKFKAPDTILERILNQIKKIDEKSINRKIKSLFEFNRISEESLSPQSTFLNLWIALESFVQTKEREGGIENVKMVVGATTSYNYIYSLVKNFIEDCQRCNLLINREGDEFIEIGRLKVSEAIYFLLDDDNQEIILNSCNEKNNLLGYRYRQLREILVDGKKASNVIESHRENITRHLQRLYRVRNSIVHSAEAHYNINLFIKHLSDYIESTMSVVLQRLEVNDNFDNLDEVFAMIRDSVDSTIEVLGSSNDLDRDEYYKILLNGIF